MFYLVVGKAGDDADGGELGGDEAEEGLHEILLGGGLFLCG
jgi:hypothetical protein